MDIRDRTILILGGYGLVGQAVARQLLRESPQRILILSLHRHEAEEACRALEAERGSVLVEPRWGDIFAFTGNKDTPRQEVLTRPQERARLIESLIDTLSESTAAEYFLHDLITRDRPHIIIDSVNTATAIAYQDIYTTSRRAYEALRSGRGLAESLEDLLLTDYVPQLIRHVQVLYQAMVKAGTRAYIKIGTSGTGGMGFNIPYTHSEEKPSRVLLSKSALGGAHTLLLFLMARTPGGLITKEVKPAAAIAWKRIGYGEVLRAFRPVPLYDTQPDQAVALTPGQPLRSLDPSFGSAIGKNLENVFIDTGENGIFSLEEFSAITTGEQMEFVTPEEIADIVVRELKGGNTGHDVINALDNAVMGPTYRAGLMRHWALEKLAELEAAHGVRSIAFENIGPPRLSKLLFEADLLRATYRTMEGVRAAPAAELSRRAEEELRANATRRREMLSIGIPALLPDGRFLRGPECKVPHATHPGETFDPTPPAVETWAEAGWVDLRVPNMEAWKRRFDRVAAEVGAIPAEDTSSRFLRDRHFWGEEGLIQPGKVVGWIFAVEEKGARMK